MASFLSAHGLSPGPTQRPFLAGSISGVIATLPALAVLFLSGSIEVEARILGLSVLLTIALGWVAMAVAGAVYARLFGRAANDPRGGWLFGMAFGFALWAGGAAMILAVVSGGLAPAGQAAIALLLSLLVWGATLGLLLPFVHRPLHQGLKPASKRAEMGPTAAIQKRPPRRPKR
jgi:hypothetical protein